MSLVIGEVYCVRGYSDPLCFAITDDTLVTKIPTESGLVFIHRSDLPFVRLEQATLVDVMRSWAITSKQFNMLMDPIMKIVYRAPVPPSFPLDPSGSKKLLESATRKKPIKRRSKVVSSVVAEHKPKPKSERKPKFRSKTQARRKIDNLVQTPSEMSAEEIERHLLALYEPQMRETARLIKLGTDEAILLEIKKAISDGELSSVAVARKCGATRERVRRLARTIGIDYGKLRHQRKEKILAARRRGTSIRQLAKKYKISDKQVKVICREANLRLADKQEAKRASTKKKILKGLRDGKSLREMADRYGLTEHYIRYHVAMPAGIKIPRQSRNDWQSKKKLAEQALRDGVSVMDIAKQLRVRSINVYRLKDRLGL